MTKTLNVKPSFKMKDELQIMLSVEKLIVALVPPCNNNASTHLIRHLWSQNRDLFCAVVSGTL